MPIEIKPDVEYRIKNVDFGTCLELRDYEQDFVLRPEKESIFQHFIFNLKESLGPNDLKVYHIKPVKLKDDPEAFLNAHSSNVWTIKLDDLSNSSLSDWVFSENRSDPGRVYMHLNMRVGPGILHANGSHEVTMSQNSSIPNRRSFSSVPLPNQYKWEIIEVDASTLPEGDNQNYRIRTLVGTVLEVNANGAVELEDGDNSRANRHPNPGNGHVTIRNVETNKYLTTRDAGEFTWEVVTSDQEAAWQIQPTSSLTYSIYISRRAHIRGELTDQKFALAIGQNKAILKPKKSAYNQTWLIEPENAFLSEGNEDQNAGGQNTRGQDGRGQNIGSQNLADNEVASGLTKGSYQIRSAHSNKYFLTAWDDGTSGAARLHMCADPPVSKNYNTHFKVEQYKTGVTIFTKSLATSRTLVVNNGNGTTPSLNPQNTSYMLTLVPTKRAKHFIIFDNSVVLTCPLQLGQPTLAAKEQNNDLQVWEFIPA